MKIRLWFSSFISKWGACPLPQSPPFCSFNQLSILFRWTPFQLKFKHIRPSIPLPCSTTCSVWQWLVDLFYSQAIVAKLIMVQLFPQNRIHSVIVQSNSASWFLLFFGYGKRNITFNLNDLLIKTMTYSSTDKRLITPPSTPSTWLQFETSPLEVTKSITVNLQCHEHRVDCTRPIFFTTSM